MQATVFSAQNNKGSNEVRKTSFLFPIPLKGESTMEQSSLTVIQDDLAARSKKALIRGILSVVIPVAVIIFSYIIFMILTFGLGIGAGLFDSNQTAIVLVASLFTGYFFFLIISGIIMMVLGKGTWNRVKAIRQDAINAGVRRPATSFVAHVFGIYSFFSGLFLIIFFTVLFLIFALVFIFAGVISLA